MFKLYNENCFETMSREFMNNYVDVILTSPPYNMTNRKGGNADTGRYDIYKDWLPEKEYIDFTVKLFNAYDKVLKKNGVILYNFSYSINDPTLPYKIICAINDNTNFTLADTIIWKKNSGMPFPANKRRLSRIWEYIFVIVRKSEIDTYNCYKGISKISERTNQTYYNVYYNLIEAKNNDGFCKLNQATFSTELCTKLLNIYSKENDVVYDSFLGTGTTAVACKNLNRYCIGSEISIDQYDYTINRLKKV